MNGLLADLRFFLRCGKQTIALVLFSLNFTNYTRRHIIALTYQCASLCILEFHSMPKKLFIIGRPGSGKTTAADFITSFVNSEHFSVQNFNDYDILRQMSRIDTMHSRFLPTEHDGF